MTTGERIRKVRASLGLTQVKFAETVGVCKGTIYRQEKCESTPRLSTLRLYADAVCVPLSEFTGESREGYGNE